MGRNSAAQSFSVVESVDVTPTISSLAPLSVSKVTAVLREHDMTYCSAVPVDGIVTYWDREGIAMDIQTAVRTVLSKYATFSGRAPRSEYWWWFLALLLFNLFLRIIDSAFVEPLMGSGVFDGQAGGPLGLAAGLALLLPNLAVTVRRLRDIDRSGWWILLALIPLIGYLILLYWLLQPSHVGVNRFGEPLE